MKRLLVCLFVSETTPRMAVERRRTIMAQRLRVHFSFELTEVRFHALIRTVQIIRILSYVQRTVLIERPKV